MRGSRRVLVAVLTVAMAGTAAAQSKRYPPERPDKDREAETRSNLWEGALHPDLRPYEVLITLAEQELARKTADDTKLALTRLDEAIASVPTDPRAYAVRGRVYLGQRDWTKCADDLGAAEDRWQDSDPVTRTRSRLDLGVCQARANRLADAERTLVRAAATGTAYRGEIGLRLGEVRIALGKLDEAIDALTAALESNDIQHQQTRWLLIAAFDRSRRPTEALEYADLARRLDPQRTYIEAPLLPHLGTADAQYFLGAAYRYATPKPEFALLYFRQFVKLAPDSPWRRRADEHVRELSNIKFPAKETITLTGPASTTVEELRAAIEKSMKPMRACLAKLPPMAYQVTIVKNGPRTPVAPNRPSYRIPAPSIKVAPLQVSGLGFVGDVDAPTKCIETEAGKLKMPVPKDKDVWYMMSFLVVP